MDDGTIAFWFKIRVLPAVAKVGTLVSRLSGEKNVCPTLIAGSELKLFFLSLTNCAAATVVQPLSATDDAAACICYQLPR